MTKVEMTQFTEICCIGNTDAVCIEGEFSTCVG